MCGSDREKLIALIIDAKRTDPETGSFTEWLADFLLANGVTFATDKNVGHKWIPVSEPPEEYRDEYGELIPFLVCVDETEYPFRAMYDGKKWGDGLFEIPVKWYMPLPEPPKGD